MEFNDEFWFNQELLAKKSSDEDGETVIVFNINRELGLGAVDILAKWLEHHYKSL